MMSIMVNTIKLIPDNQAMRPIAQPIFDFLASNNGQLPRRPLFEQVMVELEKAVTPGRSSKDFERDYPEPQECNTRPPTDSSWASTTLIAFAFYKRSKPTGVWVNLNSTQKEDKNGGKRHLTKRVPYRPHDSSMPFNKVVFSWVKPAEHGALANLKLIVIYPRPVTAGLVAASPSTTSASSPIPSTAFQFPAVVQATTPVRQLAVMMTPPHKIDERSSPTSTTVAAVGGRSLEPLTLQGPATVAVQSAAAAKMFAGANLSPIPLQLPPLQVAPTQLVNLSELDWAESSGVGYQPALKRIKMFDEQQEQQQQQQQQALMMMPMPAEAYTESCQYAVDSLPAFYYEGGCASQN